MNSLRSLALGLVALLCCATPSDAQASTIKKLLRRSSAVENVTTLESLSARSARRVDSPPIAHPTDVIDVDDALRRLRAAGHVLDHSDVRALRGLNPAQMTEVLVLDRGARTLRDGIPDLALRTRCLDDGGPELLRAVGDHPEMVDDVIRTEALITSRSLAAAPGGREATLDDLGRFVNQKGSAGLQFLREHVWPNRVKLAAAGTLAWLLIEPDSFMNTLGGISEQGARLIVEAGGVVAAGAIEGASSAAETATNEVIDATARSIERGFGSVLGGLGLVVVVLALAFRRVRHFVLLPFRWLNSPPQKANADRTRPSE
ncbi:MAG: hypothetical protein ACYSWX_11895 [Planctomycetota bacterium]|jgi:hypothetical protein